MTDAPTDAPQGDQEPSAPEPNEGTDEAGETVIRGAYRRAPKIGAFLVAGALAGVVVAVIAVSVAALVRESTSHLGAIYLLVSVAGGVAGLFAGGAIALRQDRRSAAAQASVDNVGE